MTRKISRPLLTALKTTRMKEPHHRTRLWSHSGDICRHDQAADLVAHCVLNSFGTGRVELNGSYTIHWGEWDEDHQGVTGYTIVLQQLTVQVSLRQRRGSKRQLPFRRLRKLRIRCRAVELRKADKEQLLRGLERGPRRAAGGGRQLPPDTMEFCA